MYQHSNVLQAILLDQFGVLHDGQKPYPGSIEAVKALADSERRILIISNSSRSVLPLVFYQTDCPMFLLAECMLLCVQHPLAVVAASHM